MSTARFDYVLRLADSPLILGQRLSEWCGHGPVLEEDLALTNVALDLIGQARLLLAYAGKLENKGRDEDQLAFLRAESEYRNFTLVELPNGDFGRTVMRNLLFGAYQQHLWETLQRSGDSELAAIAAKSVKEARYHLRHAMDWTLRLGDGTEESHARMQAALEALWPYTAEFFAADALDEAAVADGIGVAAACLQGPWDDTVRPLLEEATLRIPQNTPFRSRGKHGVHSEHMGHLLTEMQYMQRAYPGLQW
jgi:ring-1,2-phenylacetyl-CoA epoxidase subunit PaaC